MFFVLKQNNKADAQVAGLLAISLTAVNYCAILFRRLFQAEYFGGVIMRVKITLACTECKQRNYDTYKNKKNDPDRLEMNKYCRFCKKTTLHKETK